jgi:hypothetical protein
MQVFEERSHHTNDKTTPSMFHDIDHILLKRSDERFDFCDARIHSALLYIVSVNLRKTTYKYR